MWVCKRGKIEQIHEQRITSSLAIIFSGVPDFESVGWEFPPAGYRQATPGAPFATTHRNQLTLSELD